MYFTDIRIQHFRCLSSVRLTPSPGLNIISGDNAAGKTSLLEALLFLSRGRSIRHARSGELVEHEKPDFTLFGRFKREEHDSSYRVGMRRDRTGGGSTRLNGRNDVPLHELAATLPIQIVEPELHKLVDEGASHRRRFLDWGVFHVEHGFLRAWQRYRRALHQRNYALRHLSTPDELLIWTHRLSEAAELVDHFRSSYIRRLTTYASIWSSRLFEDPHAIVSLRYSRGWREDCPLEEALNQRIEHDRRVGHTSCGPHRADVAISLGGGRVRHRASRGQQKIIFIVLVLSQLELFREATGDKAILLVDDLAAELGPRYLGSTVDALASLGSQVFVSIIDPSIFKTTSTREARRFHVEQGGISES